MKWIRKQVGWIAAAAVGGFLLWLVGTVVSLKATQGGAGSLFGKKIPLSAYLHAQEALIHRAIFQYGDRYREELTSEELEHQTWERLMLLAEAKRKRIRVTDQEVVEKLRKTPIFQGRDGSFDLTGYEALIQYNLHTNARAFEEELREDLMIQRLFDQATGNLALSDQELRARFREREEMIRVSTFTISRKELAQEIAEAARQDPRQFEKAAKQLKLKIIPSDFFKRSASVPEFGNAGLTFGPAFSLEPGQVTGPIEGPKGWRVVKLEEKQPADERAFDELKESLRREVLAQNRFKATLTWYSDLRKRANIKKTLPIADKGRPQEHQVP